MFAVFFYHQTNERFLPKKNEKFLSEKRLLNPSENKNSQALDIESIGHKILSFSDQILTVLKDSFNLLEAFKVEKSAQIPANFENFFLIKIRGR
jgi:hypothetical protein